MVETQATRRIPPSLLVSLGIHGLAAATLYAQPQAWTLAGSALLLNHLALCGASMSPRCSWLGANIRRIAPAHPSARSVYLTFDDGPDPAVTPKVLDVLSAAGARATFFCIGKHAAAFPDLIAEIRAKGHGIENHTFSHPHSFALRGTEGMLAEMLHGQDAIETAGGGQPSLFRAPAGMQNPWLTIALARAGLSLVSWTRRGFDTLTRDGAVIAHRVTRRLSPGDILLLHDGGCAKDAHGKAVVLDALPRVLDQLHKHRLQSEALHTGLAGTDHE